MAEDDRGTGPLCLVTGATGYIGGRLVPELLAAGLRVRCLARSPERLRDHPWAGDVEVVRGDVTDAESVARAMRGVGIGYYLVHALGTGGDFEETDRRAARIFGEQARAAGLHRLVYLGGLTPHGVPERELSPHLRSRAEVGRILLDSGVPTAVLRAAVVIGSGSASFEMLRHLTERLPVMVTPSWVRTRIQPVAVRDVLRALVGCAGLPADVNRTFDIGGPDVLTYQEMMIRYAAVAELPKRLILPVPMLSPGLSSHWVGLVTPVPASIARPLTESLRYEVVCHEHDIARYVPDPPGRPFGFDEAVRLALRRVREAQVTTRWSSASLPGAPSDPLPTDPDWAGGSLYTDCRERSVDAPREALWRVVEGIGGDNGWYSFPLAWAVRGWLDRLIGGVGLRRGRRDAARLRVGDSLDFWRVEEIEPGHLLRLRAEMRLPGPAWLEMYAETDGTGRTRYRQRALFHPRGLLGHAYWWSVSPFHAVVFGGMARNIARAAEADANAGRPVREGAATGDG
ncbi:SDR family oxidoreductase [Streptomyces antibioticus]|uniref:SDR family oxidoreductase n=1 Tax=Streptomyces antibioticus TaxID=1890 RepID=UPI0004C94585